MKQSILQGDVMNCMTTLEDASVDMVMTSPPYWGLRDYGVEGQWGLEKHPSEWIERMVELGEEIKRVLKPTGTYWLNVGDTYCSTGGTQVAQSLGGSKPLEGVNQPNRAHNFKGAVWLQPKQLLLMPSRLAVAMQDEGWILRNDVIWHKPNPMPSSVRDRFSNTYEHLFLFAKQKKYYFDLDDVRKPHKSGIVDKREGVIRNIGGRTDGFTQGAGYGNPLGKNPGDFLEINTQPYKDAHFAVFPEKLVETPLKAGCPMEVCVECGKPRERIIEKTREETKRERKDIGELGGASGIRSLSGKSYNYPERKTVGWSDCGCGTGFQPGVVLDTFAGTGTVASVALKQGKSSISIELSKEYCQLIKKRLKWKQNRLGNIEFEHKEV